MFSLARVVQRIPAGRPRLWPAIVVMIALLVATSAFAESDSESPESAASVEPIAEAANPTALGEEPLFSVGGISYRPGRGARLGDTGFSLGGFTNIKLEYTDESGEEFAIDAINLFLIFDRFDRFTAVVDAEMKDVYSADDEDKGTQDFAFNVRRFFGDFKANDLIQLRVGTFLTPIGYWNLILAPPLTETTEAPLVVEETFFEQTTTGLMLHGSVPAGEGRVGYKLFSQFLDPLESDPDLNPPDNSIGFQINYERSPGWSVGASYQSAELDNEWSHLGGLHARVQFDRTDILAEVYFQDGDDFESEQFGGFLQGTFAITETIALVGRYEHFDAPKPDPTVDSFTLGGIWRPLPFMALKVSYRFADGKFEEEDIQGWFGSFSTFF